jgi:hypothetical protein
MSALTNLHVQNKNNYILIMNFDMPPAVIGYLITIHIQSGKVQCQWFQHWNQTEHVNQMCSGPVITRKQ